MTDRPAPEKRKTAGKPQKNEPDDTSRDGAVDDVRPGRAPGRPRGGPVQTRDRGWCRGGAPDRYALLADRVRRPSGAGHRPPTASIRPSTCVRRPSGERSLPHRDAVGQGPGDQSALI
ncbi:hypothetical protein DEJ51_18965 [Streptomyces venezuelae]|uniref:Uncharacterized protein n=1 Tax=Streptomyces venezuelae TaxID=54571 RepID=A0A5P2DN98_STRVZ|nr:hypothetical protein DEJ51_18965 [Streptomyces venezuelae]